MISVSDLLKVNTIQYNTMTMNKNTTMTDISDTTQSSTRDGIDTLDSTDGGGKWDPFDGKSVLLGGHYVYMHSAEEDIKNRLLHVNNHFNTTTSAATIGNGHLLLSPSPSTSTSSEEEEGEDMACLTPSSVDFERDGYTHSTSTETETGYFPTPTKVNQPHNDIPSQQPIPVPQSPPPTPSPLTQTSPSIPDEEELSQETEQIHRAKQIVMYALSSSDKLRQLGVKRIVGYGTFGVVVEGCCTTSTSYNNSSATSGNGLLSSATIGNGLLSSLGYSSLQAPSASQEVKLAIKIMPKSSLTGAKIYKDPLLTGQSCLMEIAMLKYLPLHRGIIRYVGHWEDEGFWYLVTEFHGHDWRFSHHNTYTNIHHNTSHVDNMNLNLNLDINGGSNLSGFGVDLDPVATRPNDRSLAGLLRSFGGLNNNNNNNNNGGINDSSADNHIRHSGNNGDNRNSGKGPVVPAHLLKHIFRQLASALACLHSNNITHRDLKDENVLVDENYSIHLIDFGHAGFVTPGKRCYGNYGTSLFASPELRSGLLIEGPQADVYAMGLMLYEGVTGDLPWNVCDIRYPAHHRETCPFRMDRDNGFTDWLCVEVVGWMLHPDPRKRATMRQVMEHPFFSGPSSGGVDMDMVDGPLR